ncbi:hypothetical protein VNO77_43620 [Canavalia gladiata]|uniref:DNA-directed RNA polymerase III subunit RPC9 n=1 Tax=Canavalia gladiata TaxID=3824 RepID=A0AAN9JUJ7_CANGL
MRRLSFFKNFTDNGSEGQSFENSEIILLILSRSLLFVTALGLFNFIPTLPTYVPLCDRAKYHRRRCPHSLLADNFSIRDSVVVRRSRLTIESPYIPLNGLITDALCWVGWNTTHGFPSHLVPALSRSYKLLLYEATLQVKETLSVCSYFLFSHSAVLQMKILEANAGALTNFEVLDFLRAKGASKDPTRVIAKVAQSEYKVYDYLVNTAAYVQTRENINEFLTSVKKHDLAKAEVLNILNIRPAAEVEIYPILENCEERFPDEIGEVTEIVELVKKTLPPIKMDPEEITKVDEETTVLKDEKGNEISQDQNEGGEQMDTS